MAGVKWRVVPPLPRIAARNRSIGRGQVSCVYALDTDLLSNYKMWQVIDAVGNVIKLMRIQYPVVFF